jgi:hypothetical protein
VVSGTIGKVAFLSERLNPGQSVCGRGEAEGEASLDLILDGQRHELDYASSGFRLRADVLVTSDGPKTTTSDPSVLDAWLCERGDLRSP